MDISIPSIKLTRAALQMWDVTLMDEQMGDVEF